MHKGLASYHHTWQCPFLISKHWFINLWWRFAIGFIIIHHF